jgi:uncharacterized membrane protein YeaQ/YmgE (transglycosylase-associated protein family)
MGWLGTVFVGAIVGLVGWQLHRRRARSSLSWWLALGMTALAAVTAKLAGNLSGLFYDGQMLEWLASVLSAIVAITALNWAADR